MNKPAIVLRTLMRDVPVKINQHTYRIFKEGAAIPVPKSPSFPDGVAECEPGKYFLGVEMQLGNVPVYLGHDITLVHFLELCDRLPDGEIGAMVAATALAHTKRRHTRSGK